MFEHHFGLRENPFASGHHARFVYPSPEHQEALAHLRYGIENREPFVMITGEVGTGKTTALYDALGEWQSRVEVALITNTSLKDHELLEEILLRFGVPLPGTASKPQMLAQLERTLVAIYERGDRAILLMDEAQNLERGALEEIRLLSNLERDGIKMLQVFLVGQPELEARLMRSELRQLRQRITVHYRLQPLSAEDTERYVHHRIQVAGGDSVNVFPPKACRELHRLTHGIPREINTLGSQALLTAFVEDARAVAPTHVTTAAAEIEFKSVMDRQRPGPALPELPPEEPREAEAVTHRAPPVKFVPMQTPGERAKEADDLDLEKIESWMTELKESRAQVPPELAAVPAPASGKSSMASAASAAPAPPRRDLAQEQRVAAVREKADASDDDLDFLKPKRGARWIGVMVTLTVLAAGGVLAMRYGPWAPKPEKPIAATPAPVATKPVADSAAVAASARADSAKAAAAVGARVPAPATSVPTSAIATPVKGATKVGAPAASSVPAQAASATTKSGAPATTPAPSAVMKPGVAAATMPAPSSVKTGAAAPAVAAAAAPVDPSAPKATFGIAVATFLDAERAEQERTKLAAKTHLAASVREVKEGGSSVYKIVIGDYGSRGAAEGGASALISKGLIDEARVVANPRPKP